jgi:hypothetical protein
LFKNVFVDTIGPMDATIIKAKIPPINHRKNPEKDLFQRVQMVVS